MSDSPVKRVPVDFNYNAVNPDFLHALAQIAKYAEEKYGSWEQYTSARLSGEKSCINHIYNHLREYQLGKQHDKFGSLKMQLAAIAYNAMMEWFYLEKFGPVEHPLKVGEGPGSIILSALEASMAQCSCVKLGCLANNGHMSECPRCALPEGHTGECAPWAYQKPTGVWVMPDPRCDVYSPCCGPAGHTGPHRDVSGKILKVGAVDGE